MRNHFNQLSGGFQQATGINETPATSCTTCFDRGIDFDHGGPCPKGCPAPASESSAQVKPAAPKFAIAFRPARRSPEERALEAERKANRRDVDGKNWVRIESSQFPGLSVEHLGRTFIFSYPKGARRLTATYFVRVRSNQAVLIDANSHFDTFPPHVEAYVEKWLAKVTLHMNAHLAA